MKTKERITKPRIVAYVICCVLPLLVIGLGINLLLNNTLFGTAFFVVMVVFPITTLALLFFVIFSKMRVPAKTVLAIVILIVFAVLFIFGFAMGHFEELYQYEGSEAIQHFESEVHWKVLPALDEVGQPVKIEFFKYYSSAFLFFTNDASEYETQKVLLEEKYVFQAEPMIASGYSCDPSVKIDGYLFRTLAIDDVYGNAIHYPKSMSFVAVNDETQEIVYLSAYDDDLDFIVSLADFLNIDCGWKHMR